MGKYEKKRPAFNRMVERLEALIAEGVFRAGDKLPSLRELSEEYELSHYAIYEGLKTLRDHGLIELRHGSGAYVANLRNSGRIDGGWNITVFDGDRRVAPEGGYLSHALLGIQEEALRHNCVLTIRMRDYYEFHHPEPPFESQIRNADGLIFLGEYDFAGGDIPRSLPAVGMEMNATFDGVLSPITLDPVCAAELAVDYFRRQQRKKVRVVYLEDGPVFQMRAECFRSFWSAYGECEFFGYRLTHPFELPLPQERETGLLFCSGAWCELCMKHYEQIFHTAMTSDYQVLSMDGKSLLVPGYHPVSTLYINWRSAGHAALEELLRRLRNPSAEARRILLVPRLRELS